MAETSVQPPVLRRVDLTLDGGAVKEVIQEGNADRGSPTEGAPVLVHYCGKLPDGTVFDSSYERNEPFKFRLGVGHVIKAWDLCVATMCVGEKCRLIVSPEYGYGEAGSDPIPPNATLIFDDMELMDWEKPIDSIPDRIEAAGKLKDEGNVFFVEKKYEEAYQTYEKALDFFRHVFPTEADKLAVQQCKLPILLNQAACQLRLSKFRSARLICEQALDYDSNNVKATFRLAQSWQGIGDLVKARHNFELAIKLDPNNAELKRALANLTKLEQKHASQEKELAKRMFS